MVRLSENLILAKSKVDSLLAVKNLNLWGNELDDVSILRELPNVEVLSLSVNCIRSLEDFQDCKKVRELYLRKNEVSDLSDIEYLRSLRSLRILWLCDNPIADRQEYRAFIIHHLPQLHKLDNMDVTEAERERFRGMNFDRVMREKREREREREKGTPKKQPSPHRGANISSPPQKHVPSTHVHANPPAHQHHEPARSHVPAHSSHVAHHPPAASHHPHPSHHEIITSNKVSRSPPAPAKSAGNNSRAKPCSNVLFAILTLLNDLDGESLQIVKAEVNQKLRSGV